MEITIPYKYTPREYQLPLLDALDSGYKRAVAVWHRRAGKDLTVLNFMIKKMVEQVGVYYYFFPTYALGKKIIWDGIDKHGVSFLSHFPKEYIDGKPNASELKIKLKNGSIFQIIGTDKYDLIRGTNPIGCVFSEYSYQNPIVWDVIRPILRENKGWAVFVYTPQGHNHGYTLYEMARRNPKWFCQGLSINDTHLEDGSFVITPEDIEEERAEGMDEDLIQQEYYISFEGSLSGSYYGKWLTRAEKEGRIGNVPYEEGLKVHTAWDLGIGDATAIWFYQKHGMEIRLIDYYETSGEGLLHYAQVLQSKPYVYGEHYAPFDIEVRELGSGKSRLEVARELGINFRVVKAFPVEEGIDTVRRLFSRIWMDELKCRQGLNALKSYRKEYDEKKKEFKQRPYHDWSSHGADALKYLALSYFEEQKGNYDKNWEKEEEGRIDPFNPFNNE